MIHRNIFKRLSLLITKGDKMTQVRLDVDEYTLRVLDVVKGKFGLNNRSEALNKFAIEYGAEYVEPLPNEKFLKELDKTFEEHVKKHKARKMSKQQLKKILSLD